MTPEAAHSITPEALLENASWMRALARGLLGDPHEAEDVVQEASLAVLAGAPAASSSPRAWLGSVVRNAAWRRLRTRARRQAREERAARPESQPPPQSESLERLELQELLLKAVRQLDEPFRTTVVQRYFEGRSSVEIARAAGVPDGTVRWRLQHGLELLRERLDRRVGRESWAALLAPLALRDVALPTTAVGVGAAGTTSWILQGAIAMGSSKLLGVTAAALTLGLTFWYHQTSRAEPSSPLREAVAATPAIPEQPEAAALPEVGQARSPLLERAAVAPPAPLGEPAATPSTDAPAPASTGLLVARFVDERGNAWPGVRLRLLNVLREHDGESTKSETTGGADGRVELEVELPAWGDEPEGPRSMRHEFVASHAGRATIEIKAYVTAGRTTDLGDVVLQPGVRVRGRVVDELGMALEGAWVGSAPAELPGNPAKLARRGHELFDRDLAVRSRPDGSFSLAGVEVGARRLWAHAEGRRFGWTPVLELVEGGDLDDLELELRPLQASDRVSGRVLDPEGKPAGHMALHVIERAGGEVQMRHERTDENGEFEIVVSFDDALVDVTARRFSDQTRASSLANPAGTEGLELQLAAPRLLTVRLHDPEGAPVAGATFEVSSGFVSSDARASEHEAGEYRVPFPDAEFGLEIVAQGFRTSFEGPLHPATLPPVLELTLQPTRIVSGQVLAGGAPVAGASVELREHVQAATMTVNGLRCVQSSFPASSGTTDANGRFALDLDLDADASYWVRAVAPGWAPGEAGPFEVAYADGADALEIELSTGGVLEGYLLVPSDEKVDGRFVAASHGDGEATTRRLGADGFYRFEGLAPGSWQVVEVAEEFGSYSTSYSTYQGEEPMRWSCTVEDGRTTRFDLDLTGD